MIKLTTDEGIVGFGEAFGPPQVIVAILKEIESNFIGICPTEFPNLVGKLMNMLYHTASKGLMLCAFSGIEMAGWDVVGKKVQMPLYQLLGGKARDKFLPYASTGYINESRSIENLKQQTYEAQQLGLQAIKIKIGVNVQEDLERVQAVREISRDMKLMVDMNGNYTADTAIRSIKAIESYDIYWVEEPVPSYDLTGFQKIATACNGVVIASGEAEYTRYGFRDLIQQRLIDIVQPDLSKCGGIYEAKAICSMAQANNIRVSPHIWGGVVGRSAAAHLMASIPYYPHSLIETEPMLFEFDLGENDLRDEIGRAPLTLKDGWLTIEDSYGLGVELDEEKLKYYTME